jgi:hypothetical protein
MSVSHVQGITDHLVRSRIVCLDSFEHPAAEPDERDLSPCIEGRRLGGRHTAVVVEVSEQVGEVSARCADLKVTPLCMMLHPTCDATYIYPQPPPLCRTENPERSA